MTHHVLGSVLTSLFTSSTLIVIKFGHFYQPSPILKIRTWIFTDWMTNFFYSYGLVFIVVTGMVAVWDAIVGIVRPVIGCNYVPPLVLRLWPRFRYHWVELLRIYVCEYWYCNYQCVRLEQVYLHVYMLCGLIDIIDCTHLIMP